MDVRLTVPIPCPNLRRTRAPAQARTGSDARIQQDTDAATAADAATPADAVTATDANEPLLGIVPTGTPTGTLNIGSSGGGNPFVVDCPNGSFLFGYESRYLISQAEGICDLKPKCGKLAVRGGNITREIVPVPAQAAGNCDNSSTNPNNNSDLECSGETIVTGLDVTVAGYVTTIEIRCSSLVLDENLMLTTAPNPTIPTLADVSCEQNQIALGFKGTSGWVIDRIGLRCIDISVGGVLPIAP